MASEKKAISSLRGRGKSSVQSEDRAGETSDRYYEGIGRRKESIARVRIKNGRGKFIINDKNINDYFPLIRLRKSASAPLEKLKMISKVDLSIKVKGGGIKAQAEAVRLGLARALVLFDEELKKRLRGFGYLTRDPRVVERKKYGLKKARRAPQWKKR